jgi:uncharacterized repeat protein (TIGR03847 family)
MPRSEIDLNPIEHITADAIGKPGQRVFYLQGWRSTDIQPVTVIIEKVQLQTLATGLEQLLVEIVQQNPALTGFSTEYNEEKMRITPPVDPLFRAGEMGLGYDADQDQVVILVREVVLEEGDPEAASVVRFWCSRQQASWLADWSKEVVTRGRPICPQCGQPMEPEGHFCPKKNGHKH